jgi:hypothetical protein
MHGIKYSSEEMLKAAYTVWKSHSIYFQSVSYFPSRNIQHFLLHRNEYCNPLLSLIGVYTLRYMYTFDEEVLQKICY